MIGKNAKEVFFNRIYDETYYNLRKFVEKRSRNPASVDDILQEVYIEVFRHIDDLTTHENYIGWIYKTADNKIKKLNNVYNYLLIHEINLDEGKTMGTTNEDQFWDIEKYKKVLKEDEYELLIMKYNKGYSHKDLAKMTGKSVAGSKMKLWRITNKLRENINKSLIIALDIILCIVL